jgi:hypothetical protein
MEYQYSCCLQETASGASRLGEVRTTVCEPCVQERQCNGLWILWHNKYITYYAYIKIIQSNQEARRSR